MDTGNKQGRRTLTDSERAKRQLTRHAKFRELGEARVSAALKKIRQIGNLFNRNTYAWTADQSAKIIASLTGAVDDVVRRTAPGDTREEEGFTL
jgi:hypothetical protein